MASGTLRVVGPDALKAQDDAVANSAIPDEQDEVLTNLANYIIKEFEAAKRSRDSEGVSQRLLNALRTYRGIYAADILSEIEKFGGSKVFSRTTAVKCRGASALLRDVYLSTDRPWAVEPTPRPRIPDGVEGAIEALVMSEVQTLQAAGQQVNPQQLLDRVNTLRDAAAKAAKIRAANEAEEATEALDDLLVEGGMYKAFAEFIVDISIFPIAVLKGPTVRMASYLRWDNGRMVNTDGPRMYWDRVSPFDIWFSPGVSCAEDGGSFERVRYIRSDLDDMLGVPGYNEERIRQVLQDYDSGYIDNRLYSGVESERATLEERDDDANTRSGFIEGLEFHGHVPGKFLKEEGFDSVDEARSYFVDLWLIGDKVIKVQINPNPRKRIPYYVTSFEKVPGSVYGNGLPDILEDIQGVMNATLRSLVNNLSIASGPQVGIDEEQLSDNENPDEMFPWKVWKFDRDAYANQATLPLTFFQPNSNAQELLGVYEKFSQMADEISAIPRYMTGSDRLGGAGRTASGLAMLMNNASKVMQNVAFNIDNDVISPCVQQLYDYVMLTDTTGLLRGDEEIVVKGVTNSIKREQDRVRQLEFLQLTGNPIDLSIMGPDKRAAVLSKVASELGIPDLEDLEPNEMAFAQAVGAGNSPAPNEAAGDNAQPYLDNSAPAGGGRNTV